MIETLSKSIQVENLPVVYTQQGAKDAGSDVAVKSEHKTVDTTNTEEGEQDGSITNTEDKKKEELSSSKAEVTNEDNKDVAAAAPETADHTASSETPESGSRKAEKLPAVASNNDNNKEASS